MNAFRVATSSILRPHPHRYAGVLKRPFPVHRRNIASDRTHPKNHQIKHETVQIRDSEGNLSEHQPLSSILEHVNLDTHVVRLVSKSPPIVVVASKIEEKIRRLENKAGKKLAADRRKLVTKERQLTWFTAGGDLQYKLQSIRNDLERGNVRLDIQFLQKAGLQNPPFREMMKRLNEVTAMFEDISKEWKERTFNDKGATLFLQSTNKESLRMPTKEELEEVARQKLDEHLERVQKKRKEEKMRTHIPDI